MHGKIEYNLLFIALFIELYTCTHIPGFACGFHFRIAPSSIRHTVCKRTFTVNTVTLHIHMAHHRIWHAYIRIWCADVAASVWLQQLSSVRYSYPSLGQTSHPRQSSKDHMETEYLKLKPSNNISNTSYLRKLEREMFIAINERQHNEHVNYRNETIRQ